MEMAIKIMQDDVKYLRYKLARAKEVNAELVRALEGCITSEGAACFGDMREHPEWMQRRLYAVSDIARAAIAKARGE